jgi:hypothetical protein
VQCQEVIWNLPWHIELLPYSTNCTHRRCCVVRRRCLPVADVCPPVCSESLDVGDLHCPLTSCHILAQLQRVLGAQQEGGRHQLVRLHSSGQGQPDPAGRHNTNNTLSVTQDLKLNKAGEVVVMTTHDNHCWRLRHHDHHHSASAEGATTAAAAASLARACPPRTHA